MENFYSNIPTWENDTWKYTQFESQDQFRDFLVPLFKIPGEYQFDETTHIFNEQARIWNKTKTYCTSQEGTRDFRKYWDAQKERNRFGAILKHGNLTWYLPREYYMWLNFLPILDKMEKKFDFPKAWDTQYHLALYELIAELHFNHASLVKKRQIASSYFHAAKLINQIWFEEGPVLKMGASEEKYINEKGTWKYLNEYESFLNKETAWYRPMNPGKVMMWQQQIETTDESGRTYMKGLKGTIQGVSLEKSPTNGIGGPCHRLGTKILMHSGEFKNVEDIKIGELIQGIDNKPKKVLQTFRGVDEMLKVTQSKGDAYFVIPDHILYLKTRDTNVKYTDRCMPAKNWNSLSAYQKKFIVGIKNSQALDFCNSPNATLDPYFLGLWLGDGQRGSMQIIINKTLDPEILEWLMKFGEDINCTYHIHRKDPLRYNCEMLMFGFNLQTKEHEDNFLLKEFVKYNLFYNKHIPKDYLTCSKENRAKLLAGLIDTDGYYNVIKGHFEITTKSDQLAADIAFICRSLGAYVRMDKRKSKEHILNGRVVRQSITNCVSARFLDPSIIPTKVKRKISVDKYTRKRNIHISTIKSITSEGTENYAGIQVEDNLYLLEDFTITHNCRYFFMEEAGVNATMDKTTEYLYPSMEMGDIVTGQFIAAGSVGELSQCEPLKHMTYYPRVNRVHPVVTNLLDDRGTIGESGLFIPEQWSMPPYIDEFGNSLVEEALKALEIKFATWKKELTPEKYQLRISQHPRNIAEAFANREVSVFPLHLVNSQVRRIEDKEYPYEFINLNRTETGKIEASTTTKLPILEFPYSKTAEDKTGVIVVYERPDPDATWGTYYGSIDPVSEGSTKTSESLCSIYIYKNPIEVTRIDGDNTETFIEGDKIVCCWTGRFDDINKTHERLELIIEWYNAWTIIENNISLFIQYLIYKKKQRYLVPKDQILFLKDLSATTNINQDYGWRNVSTVFETHILNYFINYLKEEINVTTKEDGTIVKVNYGIERIPDIMVMKEMQAYKKGLNVDRIVALAALIAFAKIQQANRGYKKRVEILTPKNLENSQNLFKLDKGNPFRHMGHSQASNNSIKRTPFKNLK